MKKTLAVTLAAAMLISMTSFVQASAATTTAATTTSTTAAAAGFVTAQDNYFVLNGKPFYYSGTNNYYLNYAPTVMIDSVLDSASKMGLKVMRCWGFDDGQEAYGCEMQSALGVYDNTGFERLDYSISQASKLGIKLIIPFVNNWDDFGGMDQYVVWAGLTKTTDHDKFYTNATCTTAYKNYVSHVLNHVNTYTGIAYKDDPTIMSWELANEPRCTSDTTGDTLYNWVSEMSTYVKSIDSNHLLTVGDEGFFNRVSPTWDYEYDGATGVDWDRLITLPNIDFETMHLYTEGWGKTEAWGLQYISDHITVAKTVGKPTILEEYGVSSNKETVYADYGDACYVSSDLGTGAAGQMFWLLNGVDNDGTTLYPDYDGNRVVYPSTVATVLSAYAAKMDSKNNVTLGTASAISPSTATFDLYASNQADIPVTLTLNGNTLSGVYNGATALVAGTDYTVSDNTVTISKSYLATLTEGTATLSFAFSAGATQKLTVTVTDSTPVVSSTISTTTASFDKNPTNIADVTTSITYNGNTLKGIYNGTTALVANTDYTIATDGTATISKSYLTQQTVGTVNLTFDFNKGTDPVLAVTVSDTSPVVQGSLKVQMYNSSTQASTNGIAPRFQLVNTGTTAIDLSKVTLRYYFTEDGTQSESFWCDWSSIGSANVTSTFTALTTAVTGADHYLQIGFTSGAGTLAAGASIEVQARFAKSDWSNYNQSDDYSFNSSATSYVNWTKATAYISGNLQWGDRKSVV